MYVYPLCFVDIVQKDGENTKKDTILLKKAQIFKKGTGKSKKN